MPVHNTDIASIFEEIADFLEIEGANPFRIRAYRNAARTVSGLGAELKDMVAAGEDLTKLPGIGKELAAKLHEILETGTAKALIKLQERIPKTVIEMFKLPNLGPKRVRVLYQDLKIKNLDQLSSRASVKRPKRPSLKRLKPGLKKKSALKLQRSSRLSSVSLIFLKRCPTSSMWWRPAVIGAPGKP
jgi:DNA polymerase (family 10)